MSQMGSKRLQGKVALVTGKWRLAPPRILEQRTKPLTLSIGAASGFGAAIATRFAEEGCAVMMTDINKDGLRSQAARMQERTGGIRVATFCLDVTDGEAWSRAVEECMKEWQTLDIVVNNAGTTYKNKVRWT
jgi:3-oxoacyl-[acyl-carrier protein] reductase